MMRVTEIVRRENESYISQNGILDIGSLSSTVARDLERYVKGRIALKKKQSQKKPSSKKPPLFIKNDLAPSSFNQTRLTLSQSYSRDSKPLPGHLPVFSDVAPSYSMTMKLPDTKAPSEERSNSSSFYSGRSQ
jgi:hypothetical protein